jgi:pyroglutamyl-peptidase
VSEREVPPILVTGFGAFPGVDDNPSARLAAAVDGRVVRGVPIVGRVLAVRWRAGPEEAVAIARSLGARLVLGLGVAGGRVAPEVETLAVRAVDGRPDAAGEAHDLPEGPPRVAATIDAPKLAAALGVGTSVDAGQYVCNAWLYQVTLGLPGIPVGFVHVPLSGLDVDALLRGLASLVG